MTDDGSPLDFFEPRKALKYTEFLKENKRVFGKESLYETSRKDVKTQRIEKNKKSFLKKIRVILCLSVVPKKLCDFAASREFFLTDGNAAAKTKRKERREFFPFSALFLRLKQVLQNCAGLNFGGGGEFC